MKIACMKIEVLEVIAAVKKVRAMACELCVGIVCFK